MNQPDLNMLFNQLGLPSDEKNIEKFIHSHVLLSGQALPEAPWWNKGQSDFLAEAVEEDADWAPIVDLLANLLRKE